jgi:hypothetical protein
MKQFFTILLMTINFIVINKSSLAQDCIPYMPDSLRIYLTGIANNEKYLIYYNDTLVKTVIGTRRFAGVSFVLPIDTSKLYYGLYWPIKIYRKTWGGLFTIDTQLNIEYGCMSKYLIIYKDYRVKKRYSISYRWEYMEPQYCGTK